MCGASTEQLKNDCNISLRVLCFLARGCSSFLELSRCRADNSSFLLRPGRLRSAVSAAARLFWRWRRGGGPPGCGHHVPGGPRGALPPTAQLRAGSAERAGSRGRRSLTALQRRAGRRRSPRPLSADRARIHSDWHVGAAALVARGCDEAGSPHGCCITLWYSAGYQPVNVQAL